MGHTAAVPMLSEAQQRRSSRKQRADRSQQWFRDDVQLPAMDGAVVHHGDLQQLASRMTAFNVDFGMAHRLRTPLSATGPFKGNPDIVCDHIRRFLTGLVRSMPFYTSAVRRYLQAARFLTLVVRHWVRRARAKREQVLRWWQEDERRLRDELRERIQSCQKRAQGQVSALVAEYGQLSVDDSEKAKAVSEVYKRRLAAHRTHVREWESHPLGREELRLTRAAGELTAWKGAGATRPNSPGTAPSPSNSPDSAAAPPALHRVAAAGGQDPHSVDGAQLRKEVGRLCRHATREERPEIVAKRRVEVLTAARQLRRCRPKLHFSPGHVPLDELISAARGLARKDANTERRDMKRQQAAAQMQRELREVHAYCSMAARELRDDQPLSRGSFRVAGSFRRAGSFRPAPDEQPQRRASFRQSDEPEPLSSADAPPRHPLRTVSLAGSEMSASPSRLPSIRQQPREGSPSTRRASETKRAYSARSSICSSGGVADVCSVDEIQEGMRRLSVLRSAPTLTENLRSEAVVSDLSEQLPPLSPTRAAAHHRPALVDVGRRGSVAGSPRNAVRRSTRASLAGSARMSLIAPAALRPETAERVGEDEATARRRVVLLAAEHTELLLRRQLSLRQDAARDQLRDAHVTLAAFLRR